MVNLLAVLLAITAAYIAVLLWAAHKESERFHLMGPLLMVRTQAGKRTIDRLAKKRFWGATADVFIALTVVAGLLMVALLVWQNTLFFTHTEVVQSSDPPELQDALAIPGVNPVIPIGYGLFALAVALIIHEGGHGVLCRHAKLKVKSLGLLFFIVPIGAFVEPDEEALHGATLREKLRMFSSGPGPNIVLGMACVLLFSQVMVPALAPAHDGVAMMTVNEEMPAAEAGLEPGMFIVGIEHENIELTPDAQDALAGTYPDASWSWNHTEGPGSEDPDDDGIPLTLNLTYTLDGDEGTMEVRPVDKHAWHERYAPEDNQEAFKNQPLVLGLQETQIRTLPEFQAALDVAYPQASWSWNQTHGPGADDEDTGHNVTIQLDYVHGDETGTATVTPADRYTWYEDNAPDSNQDAFKDQPFLGVNPADSNRLAGIMDNLESPFENQGLQGALFYLALPFANLQPFPTAFHDMFAVTGALAGIGGSFWVAANGLYWLFWLNIVLGTFNALPMGPLDGGHMLRHSLHAWFRERRGIRESDVRVLATEDTGPTFVGRTPRIQDQLDAVDAKVKLWNRVIGFSLLALLLTPFVVPYFL